jgi:hypothetical protein
MHSSAAVLLMLPLPPGRSAAPSAARRAGRHLGGVAVTSRVAVVLMVVSRRNCRRKQQHQHQPRAHSTQTPRPHPPTPRTLRCRPSRSEGRPGTPPTPPPPPPPPSCRAGAPPAAARTRPPARRRSLSLIGGGGGGRRVERGLGRLPAQLLVPRIADQLHHRRPVAQTPHIHTTPFPPHPRSPARQPAACRRSQRWPPSRCSRAPARETRARCCPAPASTAATPSVPPPPPRRRYCCYRCCRRGCPPRRWGVRSLLCCRRPLLPVRETRSPRRTPRARRSTATRLQRWPRPGRWGC